MSITKTLTIEHVAHTSEPRLRRLTVVHPPELETVRQLADSPLTLGRKVEPPKGFRIEHATVSRRHLIVGWDSVEGRHYAIDLESRNGSTIDGCPVGKTPRHLTHNSVLRIGDVLLVYEAEPPNLVDDPAVDIELVPGRARAIAGVRQRIGQMARDPSPVLMIGESGAGKERIAGELHRLSGRTGSMITLNCAALSASLVESQLFGHVRGAFTGANTASDGFFQAAHRGSLFLDEIGELPLDLQPKLLRALESGEVTAVGSTHSRVVDVRVIAATNRALDRDVEAGTFRRDLFARLSLWLLSIPPLRNRRVDIFSWLTRLAAAWAEQRGLSDRPNLELSSPAAEVILAADWPENLRGLNRLVHDLMHIQCERPIAREALPQWLLDQARPAGPDAGSTSSDRVESPPATPPIETAPKRRGTRKRPTREQFVATLERNRWSIRAAARELDRDRRQIKRWITMYEVEIPQDAPDD